MRGMRVLAGRPRNQPFLDLVCGLRPRPAHGTVCAGSGLGSAGRQIFDHGLRAWRRPVQLLELGASVRAGVPPVTNGRFEFRLFHGLLKSSSLARFGLRLADAGGPIRVPLALEVQTLSSLRKFVD